MKKIIIFLFIIAAAFNLNANAAEVNWKHVEAGYISESASEPGVDVSLTGFGVNAVYEFVPGLYGAATFASETGSMDISGTSFPASGSMSIFSVGYHAPIAGNTDIYGQVNFSNITVEALGISATVTDTNYTLGVRSMLTDSFELGGSATFTGDVTGLSFNGLYYFNKSVGAGLTYQTSRGGTGTSSGYILGMRLNI